MSRRSYTINRYQGNRSIPGKIPFNIIDSQVDSTSTSLVLPGRSTENYGEKIIENLVWLLENFAGQNPPMNPTIGQVWFETSGNAGEGHLRVFNGKEWEFVSLVKVGTRFPDQPSKGETFYNNSTKSFWVYDGVGWQSIRNERIFSSSKVPTNSETQTGDLWWDEKNKKFYVYDSESVGWLFLGPLPWPSSLIGGEGKFVKVNDDATDIVFTDLPSKSLIELTDTPNGYGVDGSALVYNQISGNIEWKLFKQDFPESFTELNQTPNDLGNLGQVLYSTGTQLVWKDEVNDFVGLQDTPSGYGSSGQILESTGSGLIWNDKKTFVGNTYVPDHNLIYTNTFNLTNENSVKNLFTTSIPLTIPVSDVKHLDIHGNIEIYSDTYCSFEILLGKNSSNLLPYVKTSVSPTDMTFLNWKGFENTGKVFEIDDTNNLIVIRVRILEGTLISGYIKIDLYANGYIVNEN